MAQHRRDATEATRYLYEEALPDCVFALEVSPRLLPRPANHTLPSRLPSDPPSPR